MNRLTKLSFLFSGLSFLSMVLVRYLLGDWVPFCWLALGLCIFFAGFAVLFDRRYFKDFFTMKTTKHGMNMGVMIILVVSLLAIVNFIAVRKHAVWDFSLATTNTISDQSIRLLHSLDSPLKIRFFYQRGVEGNEESRRAFRELIKKYQDQTDKVSLEFIELNERPDLGREYGVDKGSGSVFLEYKGRRNRIDKIDEQELSSALVKVTRESKKTIYFTTGHGEPDLEESKEARGHNTLKLLLENNNYKIETIALALSPKIPKDADLLIIAGPKQSFQSFEISAIEDYLRSGGSLFLALKSGETVGIEKLTASLGLELQNNYIWGVVDTKLGRAVNQGPVMGVIFSRTSEITKSFGNSEVTLFLYPMSIEPGKFLPPGIAVLDLVKTSTDAVAYRTIDMKGEGKSGIFTLANSVTGRFPGADEKAKDFAMVVVGDSDFLNNQLLFKNLNRDLLLNSVALLAKEEGLISISPKEAGKTDLQLSQMKFTLYIFGVILPIPLLLLGLCIALWMKRRNA